MTTSNGFAASKYQQDIFNWIQNGRGDAMVSAVAGSGKTTTLVQGAKFITSKDCAFFAFNKHIVEELNKKLVDTHMKARTIHSLGYGCVSRHFPSKRRWEVKDSKYFWLAQKVVEQYLSDHLSLDIALREKQLRDSSNALKKLCDLSRVTLTPVNNRDLYDLADEYSIDIPDELNSVPIENLVFALQAEGLKQLEYGRVMDFIDQIWSPHVLNMQPDKLDWVFVDEAQDLNAAQRELVLKCRAPGGRMLFVGDSRQAIMHFAGADSRSYYTIQERTDAVELPLSICYRCPTSHIELAQEIVPEIEPAPNAKEGVIRSVDGVSLQDHVGEGDLILCRTTAPLISWCIRLIRNRVAARVRGRDVAANLVSTIKKIGEKTSYDKFGDALDIYYDRQLIKIGKKEGSEAKIQVLDDTVEAIRACWTDFNASGIDDLCQQLTNIFSDYSASVWLSTVHRAKGLEAERVFILHDEKLPLVWRNQKPEQYLQELNLRYVALTRAKSELIFVTPQTSELKGSVSNGRHDESAGEEAQLVSSPQMAIVS